MEEEQLVSEKFARQFLNFQDWSQASRFVDDHIKKHNTKQFRKDIALLSKFVSKINKAFYQRQQELSEYMLDESYQLIVTQCFFDNGDQSNIVFMSDLMLTLSQNQYISTTIIRCVLQCINSIKDIAVSKNKKWRLSKDVQSRASQSFNMIREDIQHDYANSFFILNTIKPNYWIQLTKKFLREQMPSEAGSLIVAMKLHESFDCLPLFIKLVGKKNNGLAKKLISEDKELQKRCILALSRNFHESSACLKFVQEFKLDINDYPKLLVNVQQQACQYQIKKCLKTPESDDYMPIWRVEEILQPNEIMLNCLVKKLMDKKKYNEAYGVFIRHNLGKSMKDQQLIQQINNIKYDKEQDKDNYQSEGVFGPITKPAKEQKLPFLAMPQDVTVHFISKKEDLALLDGLKGETFIGIDSEWKPTFTRLDKTVTALLQISGKSSAYLVDTISLIQHQKALGDKIAEVFSSKVDDKDYPDFKTPWLVGFSFESDIASFNESMPTLCKSLQQVKQFLDLQTYYLFAKKLDTGVQQGLKKVVEALLQHELCKGEQVSDWQRRPLRLSQQHYGALDAYCLVVMTKILLPLLSIPDYHIAFEKDKKERKEKKEQKMKADKQHQENNNDGTDQPMKDDEETKQDVTMETSSHTSDNQKPQDLSKNVVQSNLREVSYIQAGNTNQENKQSNTKINDNNGQAPSQKQVNQSQNANKQNKKRKRNRNKKKEQVELNLDGSEVKGGENQQQKKYRVKQTQKQEGSQSSGEDLMMKPQTQTESEPKKQEAQTATTQQQQTYQVYQPKKTETSEQNKKFCTTT